MTASFRRAWNRIVAVFLGKPLDSDLDAEIQAHLDAAIEDNIQRGIAPDEARRQAFARFGTITGAKERHRDSRGIPALDVLRQDTLYAGRTMRRDPVFTAIVVLVLGLGIGANVAVFSVVDAVLLRPLPFREPSRLVWLATNGGKGGFSNQTYTISAFEEFRRHNQSFQDVTGFQTFYGSVQYKLIGSGDPLPITGVQVAGNFFPLLGVDPILGRNFTTEECQKGGRATALLSYPFWQRQFGGDAGIIGRSITVDASPSDITGPVTIVGVLPPSFDFGSVFSPGMQVDFFVPAYMDFWRTWGNTLALVGRLKPAVTLAQAQAESYALFPQLRAAHREWWEDYQSTLFQLQDHVSGKYRRTLIVLWCAVGLMLLIVCLNVSNLLIARVSSRGKEFAVRVALGAGRGRMLRQLLTESFILCGSGAALGCMIAWTILLYLARNSHLALPMLSTVRLDGTALAWTILIAGSGAIMFGVAPAFKMAATNVQEVLKESGAGLSQGRSHERLRSALVVSEVALACVLLVGAGLLLRSFLRLLDVDLGFAPAQVAALQIEIADGGKAERRGPMAQEILSRIRALPGIEAAGTVDLLPLDRNRSWGLVSKENLHDTKPHGAFVYVISPGYLQTMGMRLRRGRDISWRDSFDREVSIIINEAAARREWPDRDPIGQQAYGISRQPARVVGVISDVRESSLEDQAGAQAYIPMTQVDPEGVELVVRTRLPIAAVQAAVMPVLRTLNPGQPRTQFRPIQ
ncbi:MAG: ABC transporter permease, partial [Acidobacteriaceae bacterium]|nr:ABC transporter permease [Acidobacteriaceae bacterium]